MIGKIFRHFSNDWKKFSREGNGRIFSHKGHKEHKEGGKKGGRDARWMVNIENHENRFADMETREGRGWDAGTQRKAVLKKNTAYER